MTDFPVPSENIPTIWSPASVRSRYAISPPGHGALIVGGCSTRRSEIEGAVRIPGQIVPAGLGRGPSTASGEGSGGGPTLGSRAKIAINPLRAHTALRPVAPPPRPCFL